MFATWPTHLILLDLITWWAEITKLLITQFSPTSCYFLLLRSKFPPQNPIPEHPQPMFFPPPPSVGPVSRCPGSTSALGLLCSPKHSIQHRFNNPVPLIKGQRSLTEAVLISFGSASSFPKTL
jgi:hypothetical protein